MAARGMSLFEPDRDKIQDSIDLLRMMEPPEGYHLAFSGGKDSIVIYDLAKRSGVKFSPCYYITTVDPPELIWFIKKNYPEVRRLRPALTMWQLIRKKGILPTRVARFCCEYFKERRSPPGAVVATGVRAAESARRAMRQEVEECYRKKSSSMFVHPIVKWTDRDVWDYIKGNALPYPSLYDEGWQRLGCVLCPFSNLKKEAERWPKIANLYKRAAYKVWTPTKSKTVKFQTPEEYWQWWLSGRSVKETSAYKRTIMDELFT